ncbi:hypothetical protein VNI00_015899 [Paramarasmius palmivorus]|uniref:Uncharacterized protein n=1 Tax=Paramarasmius palmivorus TaxID=297713 RepID=A0AAW0BHI5_9AGAR
MRSRLLWKLDHDIQGGIMILLLAFVTVAVDVPLDILKNRAIVTPYKLPYFNFLTSLRILLSPTERAKPWKLYLLPGLFITYLAKLLVPTAMVMVRFLLLAVHEKNGFDSPLFMAAALGCFLFALACSVVQAPLQVIYTRLSIQRCRSDEDASEAEEAQRYGVERYSKDDEVITLRDEQTPYEGLWHCASTIFTEEGWRTLFRAWWLAAIAVYVSS